MSDSKFDINDLMEHTAGLDKTAGESDGLAEQMNEMFDRTGLNSRYASFINNVASGDVYMSACGRPYESESDRDRHEGQCEDCVDINHGVTPGSDDEE